MSHSTRIIINRTRHCNPNAIQCGSRDAYSAICTVAASVSGYIARVLVAECVAANWHSDDEGWRPVRGPDSLALRRGARRANLELDGGREGGAVNKLRAGPCPRPCRSPPLPHSSQQCSTRHLNLVDMMWHANFAYTSSLPIQFPIASNIVILQVNVVYFVNFFIDLFFLT